MKGKYYFRLQHKKKLYELEIKRNITVIQGNSATGKTHLIRLLNAYLDYKLTGKGPGKNIIVNTNADIDILTNRDWSRGNVKYDNQVLFCDEGFAFLEDADFISFVKSSNCYFVFITREPLNQLAYSTDEIYGIKVSNNMEHLESVYNEQFSIYNHENINNWLPDIILTEDSDSGLTFWKKVAKNKNIKCDSSDGNSNIKNYLSKFNSDKKLLVVADNAAFGSQIDRVKSYIDTCDNIKLVLPESFEFMILNSKIVYAEDLGDVLEHTYNFADSKMYTSWEDYYYEYLKSITKNDKDIQYSKKNLREFYWKYNINKILRANNLAQLCAKEKTNLNLMNVFDPEE